MCDAKYGPTWQCIVGEDFKAAFTHETKHFMFIAYGKQNVVRADFFEEIFEPVLRVTDEHSLSSHIHLFLFQLVWRCG